MNALIPYLAALHQQDLLEQAELFRRAKAANDSKPSRAAWRRSLGGLLASAARSLDPATETELASPTRSGTGPSPLPVC
jgi:hypothetical protein